MLSVTPCEGTSLSSFERRMALRVLQQRAQNYRSRKDDVLFVPARGLKGERSSITTDTIIEYFYFDSDKKRIIGSAACVWTPVTSLEEIDPCYRQFVNEAHEELYGFYFSEEDPPRQINRSMRILYSFEKGDKHGERGCTARIEEALLEIGELVQGRALLRDKKITSMEELEQALIKRGIMTP